jgi:hypothetical protein
VNKKDRDYIFTTFENEGFDSALVHYSHFDEIKDEKFHAIRKAYLAAREALVTYLEWDETA